MDMSHTEMLAESMTLEPGQRLGDFLVTRVVGQGGFGVVYEAEDLTLQRRVAIKEYLPAQLAARVDGIVHPVSSRYAKTFELGRRSFLAEARLLAQFSHPGLLEVLHFWEQNGTAYMVMPFYEGRTLDQVLANGPNVVTEAWLRAVIRPVLDALEHMHGEDCYHRDVSADNILLCNDGKALLLDLGAARRVIGESDRAMTVMLKPGYAPIEQYADDPSNRQGPWTDIYSVAALLYFAVTNRMPPASASRVMHDSLPSLTTLELPGYGRRFLEAIDRGLSIRPEERPRTVGEFRSMLFAASPVDGIQGSDANHAGADDTIHECTQPREAPRAAPAAKRPAAPRTPLVWAAGGVAVVFVAVVAWFATGDGAPPSSVVAAASPVAPVRSGPATGSGSSRAEVAQGPAKREAQPRDPLAAPDRAAHAQASTSTAAATPSTPRAGAAPLASQAAVASPALKTAAAAAVASLAVASKPVPAADAASRTGAVRLAVMPWGEVFVDGVSRGITPPLKQLTLDAGSHHIEIRNPAGRTLQTQVDVVAGRSTTLSHRFP